MAARTKGKTPPADKVFSLRLPDTLVSKIDEWRRKQPDLPNRSEAMRRLIEAQISFRPKAKP